MPKRRKPELSVPKLLERQLQLQNELRNEFKKQAVTGITAAFAFLIGLVWREPIEATARQFLAAIGVASEGLRNQILTAVIITIVAAAFLVLLARWASPGK